MPAPAMRLWLLTQNVNTGFETADQCLVISESEAGAKNILPIPRVPGDDVRELIKYYWADQNNVQARYLGVAIPGTLPGLIFASFRTRGAK